MLEEPSTLEDKRSKWDTPLAEAAQEAVGPIFPPYASQSPPSSSLTVPTKLFATEKCVIPPSRDRTPTALAQQRCEEKRERGGGERKKRERMYFCKREKRERERTKKVDEGSF